MVSHTPKYTPRQYLDGIRQGDTIIINCITEEYFPRIRGHVTRNSGVEQDAEDLFQDAMAVVFWKTSHEGLDDLDSSFYTFLFGICKNLWLTKLRKEKSNPGVTFDKDLQLISDENLQDALENLERHRLFWEKFELLEKDCRKVLTLSLLEKKKAKEIASLMGYGSADYVRKKKSGCKKSWIKLIRSDPRFGELRF